MTQPSPIDPGVPAQRERPRRPGSVTAVAVLLILLGVLTVLAGIALSAVTGCCGSSEPADGTPTLIALVIGAALAATAVGLLSGQMPRRAVLFCASAVPVVVLAVSGSSSDLQGLVPFVVLGWLGLWGYLRRPAVAAWVGRRGR